MNNWRIKTSLFLNYFVFAILLNSVGTVILQVQNNFSVSKPAASVLEMFKDLPIAIISFLIASFVARMGYKRTMLAALGFISAVALLVPTMPSFLATKMLFAATGASFALIKVSVFATIGLVTGDGKEHASFMNFLESFFMVGVLSGYFIFGAFVDEADPASTSWFKVYYFLGGLSLLAFLLLLASPLDESAIRAEKPQPLAGEFAGMLKLSASPLVMVFVSCAFLYVLVEQSIMSWLPTFNSQVLHLSNRLSIEMASILAASIALGRLLAGFALRRLPWLAVLIACLLGAAALVLLVMPMTRGLDARLVVQSLRGAPLAAFAFPMIGMLLAPIYPAINSVILSSLPERQHAPMSGLIVVFSSLGGTTGSIVTAFIFRNYGGQTAFYFSLVPIAVLAACLMAFQRLQKQKASAAATEPLLERATA
ncbi:MAG TPA: MFS transporter [Elusimicrobia bacterium]|nr:MFS transporter [Elusimicrobiota bacterium]HBT62395.1 MFS transporter [Elusimicrobiota bacterium]